MKETAAQRKNAGNAFEEIFITRVEAIRAYAGKILSALPPEKRQAAVLHTYGVAECCALLALRRGLDAEIAFVSDLLHDLYACPVGSYLCHAQSGAEMARPFLRDSGLFSKEEQTAILSAVYRHASKELVNGPYDEVLKDADALEPFLNGVAEGNVDNRNESGVVSRTRGDRIGCYLRIPDCYTYDGWKFDYQLP